MIFSLTNVMDACVSYNAVAGSTYFLFAPKSFKATQCCCFRRAKITQLVLAVCYFMQPLRAWTGT